MSAVPPPPPSIASLAAPAEDPLKRLWGPVTIRVVWELYRRGASVRPTAVRDARETALWRTPPLADVAEAEERAVQAVDEYLRRLDGDYTPVGADPDIDLLPDPRWRTTLLAQMDELQETVFRLHFGDGVAIEALAERFGLPLHRVRAAREVVRDEVRELLVEAGLATPAGDPARLDRLATRIANAAGDACPGPGGLATEPGRAHAEGCPRCGRALRLMREGALSPSDLFVPDGEPCLPPADLDLVCILVHPDARRHRRALARALPDALWAAEDVLLVPAEGAREALVPLAEEGTPPASMLRLVRKVFSGRWSPRVLTGPGYDTLIGTARSLAWGEARGLDALPEPLPGPPSSARLWVGALLAVLLALGAGLYVTRADPGVAEVALVAEQDAGGVAFTTDAAAYVDVIALTGFPAAVEFHSATPAEKGGLATGDGHYFLPSAAGAWVVVAASTPLDDLAQVAASATSRDDLYARIRERFPRAAVRTAP